MCQHLENSHNSMSQYFPDYYMMLQSHSRVKESFKVPDQNKKQKNKVSDRPVDFNVIEHRLINVVLDSKFRFHSKKTTTYQVWYSIKEECLRRRILKYASLFQKRICVRLAFFSYASAKTIYHSRQNAGADRIIQLVSVKEISKIEIKATH